MTSKIILNDRVIHLCGYQDEVVNDLHKVTVDFNVTSDDYHDITTLLYSGTFVVKIPERNLLFRGTIHNYSTSITNLYVEDQIGQFKLTLIEVSHGEEE